MAAQRVWLSPFYVYGGVLANVLNEKVEGANITVQSTGASKANIFLIDDKEANLAIVQNDVMDYAYNGADLFREDGALTSFSAVTAPTRSRMAGSMRFSAQRVRRPLRLWSMPPLQAKYFPVFLQGNEKKMRTQALQFERGYLFVPKLQKV